MSFKRATYHDGMLLTAEDLRREQSYYERGLRTLARARGPGVISGLNVICDGDYVTIGAGLAVGADGELIRSGEHRVSISEVIAQRVERDGANNSNRRWYLCLDRIKQEADEVEIVYGPDRGRSRRYAGSEISSKVIICSDKDLPWPVWRGVVRRSQKWKERRLHRVALAQFSWENGTIGLLETVGRPVVADEASLTAIVVTSWEHAGTAGAAELTVTFGRTVSTAFDKEPFRVTATFADGSIKAIKGHLALSPDQKEIAWRISAASSLEGAERVDVDVDCALILDARGVAVSGAYLGGSLPSGNGSPGGVFRSWFRPREAQPGGAGR